MQTRVDKCRQEASGCFKVISRCDEDGGGAQVGSLAKKMRKCLGEDLDSSCKSGQTKSQKAQILFVGINSYFLASNQPKKSERAPAMGMDLPRKAGEKERRGAFLVRGEAQSGWQGSIFWWESGRWAAVSTRGALILGER